MFEEFAQEIWGLRREAPGVVGFNVTITTAAIILGHHIRDDVAQRCDSLRETQGLIRIIVFGVAAHDALGETNGKR